MGTLSRTTRLVIALMVWGGAMVMLYAPMAMWLQQIEQNRANDELAGAVRAIDPAGRARMTERAHEYNEALLYGIDLDEDDYPSILTVGDTDVMARLRIPSIDLDQPIRHGMSEEVLSRALGHVEGTSLPVGGPGTNAVIGGHRGLATATAFTYLNEMEVGEEVILEVAGEVLTYEAISDDVLPPGEAERQPVQLDRDLLTLITCTPLGMNTDRIVVVAERVETPDGALAGGPSQVRHFPWWAVVAGVVTAGAVVFVARPVKAETAAP
ncbi:class C sortase [Georgenia satyanarayanai]|uniref:class C sortase n=1 Tax=Georgenia satyanarayanai TaxID=860221 RepID=UPI00203DC5F5|nr:class C sortase [Georgenia satyanarayanai]MCM3659798.1 class C sortase [Georgenia satyanarayanai]